jgi:hypothetical protein
VLSALQLSSFFFAETFEGKHAEKIERYTETPRGSSETEREREREREIEADAGADAKATTKMRKRKNKRTKNKRAIETHTGLRGHRRGGFLHRLENPSPTRTST